MNVSVAIATYNGEKYLREQLDSILVQLKQEDEIVISDDNSSDNTLNIIKEYQNKDGRILLLSNPKKGLISNFENAIKNSKNDIIMLCDQDDVWLSCKVETVKKYFQQNEINLLLTDCYITDGNLKVINDSFFSFRKTKKGIVKNIIKNSYLGCAMSFRKELKDVVLPFPDDIPMHDEWIGILAEMTGKVMIAGDKLFYYRRHGSNVTQINKKLDLKKAFIWRINLIRNLLIRRGSWKG